LWRYDGAWTSEEDGFRPFEGYALFSERIDTLWIDPDLSPENVQSNLERQARTTTEVGAQSAERRFELEALFGTAHSDVTGPATRSLALTAYPNPFVESSSFSYELSTESRVTIRVFDVLGREVVAFFEDRQAAGAHELIWDRRDESGHRVASGLYVIRLHAGERVRSATVSVVR